MGKKPCLVEFRSSFFLILSSILTTVLVALKYFFFFNLYSLFFFFAALDNLASDFGFNLSSYSVVFYTTSVNSRKGKAINKETGNNDGKEIIITLSNFDHLFFDSVHVIQLDCPLVVTTGQYFASIPTSYFFFGVDTPP